MTSEPVRRTLHRLAELAVSDSCTHMNLDSWSRCIQFVEMIMPPALPAPFVAVGDDGSVGLEWETPRFYLYFVFDTDGDMAYWQTDSGGDWEGTIAAFDWSKVSLEIL